MAALVFGAEDECIEEGSDVIITPFSATPTFSWRHGEAFLFLFLLTGDVTSSDFDRAAGSPRGAHFKFIIIQDGVGGHAFAWPSICKGALPVGGAPNQTTVQSFMWDGSNLLAAGMPAVF